MAPGWHAKWTSDPWLNARRFCREFGPVRYTYAEGFFIPVPDEIEQALADMEEQGFSADAIALLRKVSENSIDLLRLDRDADTYTELPPHEWCAETDAAISHHIGRNPSLCIPNFFSSRSSLPSRILTIGASVV